MLLATEKSTDVAAFLRAMHPDGVFEIRPRECPAKRGASYKPSMAGWFHDGDAAAAEVERISALRPEAIHVTINPVKPDLLARSRNRITQQKKLTAGCHITHRRRLFIDLDRADEEGVSGISSTDEELETIHGFAEQIREYLGGLGWPEPIKGMSGNGYYLIYAIDLPNDEASKSLIKNVLAALHSRWESVDVTAFDANRLCKVLGTWARKGEHTKAQDIPGVGRLEERPHRQSWHCIPDDFGSAIVELEQLQALSPEYAPDDVKAANAAYFDEKKAPKTEGDWTREQMERWIADSGIATHPAQSWNGGFKWVIAGDSPLCPGHSVGGKAIITLVDGWPGAMCQSAKCNWGWKELANAVGGKAPAPKQATELAAAISLNGDVPLATTLSQITDRLTASGYCYARAGLPATVRGDSVTALLTAAELAGLCSEVVEFVKQSKTRTSYHPLPKAYADAWLNNHRELKRLPSVSVVTRNPVFDLNWEITQPGFNRDSGILYIGDEIQPREGTEHLDTLIGGFCFRDKKCDRTNYVAMLVTSLLTPHFMGEKPLVFANGNQPGLGKTKLMQLLSIIRDGCESESITYNPNDEEFEKVLGARVRAGTTTIIIDNAKLRGANARVDSPVLERSITDKILSYRLLGTSSVIRAENSHIFCLTANACDISPDLLSRACIVNLFHEGNPNSRPFDIDCPESFAQEHRGEIIGELLGIVDRWLRAGKPRYNSPRSRFSAWARTLGDILSHAGLEGFLSNSDKAANELDEVRRDFMQLLKLMAADHKQHWHATNLASIALTNQLLTSELGGTKFANARAVATKMGQIATRFVNECYTVEYEREVEGTKKGQTRLETIRGYYKFTRDDSNGKCTVYKLEKQERKQQQLPLEPAPGPSGPCRTYADV